MFRFILPARQHLLSGLKTSTNHFQGVNRMGSSSDIATRKLSFIEIDGDLFSAPKHVSLGHCVGGDCIMGAGIAVKFKQIYGQVDELLKQNIGTGGVAVLRDEKRYIYYLVTKNFSYEKPTYDSLAESLNSMRKHMEMHGVKDLALPRIGCGIDGLEWDMVKSYLEKVFGFTMNAPEGYVLREVSGDLFSVPKNYSIGHCVSADLRMGKGIAVKFRDTFGQVQNLKSQNAKTGGVAILKDNNRYIYNLVTKDLAYHKPTYQTLSSSLWAMKEHMQKNDVKHLALPRIGCGLDGLQWNKVKDLLNDIFKDENLEIVIYNYVPPAK